jgi:hypothetical protein
MTRLRRKSASAGKAAMVRAGVPAVAERRPVELQLEERYAEHFRAEWEAGNGGVTVYVVRVSGSPLQRRPFKGPMLKTALALAYAFMEDELAKLDRAEWGKKRRRAGRKRQAAFKAASKAQRP